MSRQQTHAHPTAGRRVARIALIFVAWSALTAFTYRDTESNFLRAESGWYLFLSHSDTAVQSSFVRALMTKSFSGHYAPFAFAAEFATAKTIGSAAAFWKWRQIALVAILVTTLYELARQSARLLTAGRGEQLTAAAAAIAALIVFQPNMKDFIAWPFMIMQLMWLLLSALTLIALLKTTEFPGQSRWPWLAAGTAYGSLHFLGLGLATVAAAATVLAAQLVWRRHSGTLRKSAMPLCTLVLAAAIHGGVMLKLMRAETGPHGPPWQLMAFTKAALGFLPNFAVAAARGLFTIAQPIGDASWMSGEWPYGAGCLLVAFSVIGAVIYRGVQHPTTGTRTASTLLVFSIVSFVVIAALVSARQWHDPSPQGFADYLIGSRYLLPANSAFVGLIIVLVLGPAEWISPRVHNGIAAIIALAAVIGQIEYGRHIYPKVEPRSTISHGTAWRSVVAMARQSLDAGLPVPDVPLEVLTQDFPGWDLKLFEPLLRADLGLAEGATLQFIDWNQFAANVPEEYARSVPALRDVARDLRLSLAGAASPQH